jgi:hypothetical protein
METMWKEAAMAYFKVGPRKTTKTSVRIAGPRAEI